MNRDITLIFKNRLRPRVYLFEINTVSYDRSTSAVIGTIIIDINEFLPKYSIIGVDDLGKIKDELCPKCIETAKNIASILEEKYDV